MRPPRRPSGRSSSDEHLKANTVACFLAIGLHKVHLIPLSRIAPRNNSSSLMSQTLQASYGILSLSFLEVSETDDSLELTFRMPLQQPKVIRLASLASHDIAVRLRYVEEHFRPEWETRPFKMALPRAVSDDILRNSSPHSTDLDSLDRTLTAYCVAYDVNPGNIRYQITHPDEDGPCFQLLPPVDARSPKYVTYELLAIMRALRYNEAFSSLSFTHIELDALNRLKDVHGHEHVCAKTKRGTPIQLSIERLNEACLLVQEIRALAVTNRRLRKMDFTSCIVRIPEDNPEDGTRDSGCGIVEALFPLCKHNTTNVDWVILDNIQLGDTDLDYLVEAAVLRACHFRGFGLANTGLTDRSLSFVLDALRHQENTLESLDLSRNVARLTPASFDFQIGAFAYIRKLNLANLTRTSGSEPLLTPETLAIWRLSELILSGVPLNTASIDAIGCYLHNFNQSKGLRELRLDSTSLNGKEIALLMQTMTERPGQGRELHLDVSRNSIEAGLVDVTRAISGGFAPTYLTIRHLDLEDEGAFRKLILAVATNSTISSLDLSQASLPGDASEATCQALEKMFAENKTLVHLDISGGETRLETSKLGVGVNKALCGLKDNVSLRTLRIEHQQLGIQGASTLADVLRVNSTLVEVHCDHNDLTLSGFTDIVNSLHRNTSILYLSNMEESRQLALKQTEDHVKQMRDETSLTATKTYSVRDKIANKVGLPTVGTIKSKSPSGPSLTDQDIKAALTLVDESWTRQIYRLSLYLRRNLELADGVATTLDIEEEEFERPSSGTGSIRRMIEQAKLDRTPTLEKQLNFTQEFGSGSAAGKRRPLSRGLAEKDAATTIAEIMSNTSLEP